MQSAKIISNSSPLINLSKIEKLDLIEKLYSKVFIPHAVFEELILQGKAKSEIEGIMELIEKNILEVREVKNINFGRMRVWFLGFFRWSILTCFFV